MTEFDDERIASLKQRKKTVILDRLLTYTGLALFSASAFFPWYVFFNADKFGINVATSSNSRELPDWLKRATSSASRRLPWSTRTRGTKRPRRSIR